MLQKRCEVWQWTPTLTPKPAVGARDADMEEFRVVSKHIPVGPLTDLDAGARLRADMGLSWESRQLTMVCEVMMIALSLSRERGGRSAMKESEKPKRSFGDCRKFLSQVKSRNLRWQFPSLTTTASFRKGFTKPLKTNYLNDSGTFETAHGVLNSPIN